jgi:leucyl aminopeptidase
MRVSFESTSLPSSSSELLAVLVENTAQPPADFTELDGSLGGALARAIELKHLRPGKPDTAVVSGSGSGPERVALVGLGDVRKGRAEAVRKAGGRLATTARGLRATKVSLAAPESADDLAWLIEGFVLSHYRFDTFKSQGEESAPNLNDTSLTVLNADDAARTTAQRAADISLATNWGRDLANAPANLLPPATLADEAKALADAHPNMSFRMLDRAAIEKEGLNLLAAVGQGSVNEPRLIVLEWNPPGASETDDERMAFIGKAVTFDSGGISIKPSAGMQDMRMDKSGGCGVIAAMRAVAETNAPRRVLAVVASAENMPGGNAYRPGDVFTAFDGTTVEVTNTDAEGRLILADAIAYARTLGCGRMIELSTLTGAMVIALGHYYAGCIAESGEWTDTILGAAATTGDHAWHMPMHEAYKGELKSDIADWSNSGGRAGGMLAAGLFLKHFAKDTPFAHLDIAGAGMLSKPRDYFMMKGANGWGVRLLTELASAK